MEFLSSCDVDLRVPLVLPRGSQVSFRVVMGTSGFLESHCRENRPHLDLCPETLCSSPVATGISGLHSRFTWGVRPRLGLRGESRGFPLGLAGSLGFLSSCDMDLRVPLVLPQGSQVSFRVVTGTTGFLASHCRGSRPHLDLCPETPCSSPVETGISGLHSMFTWGVRPHLELKQSTLLSSPVAMGISWSPLSGAKGVKPPMEF